MKNDLINNIKNYFLKYDTKNIVFLLHFKIDSNSMKT